MKQSIARYIGIGVLLFVIWNLILGFFPFLLCLLYILLLPISYGISYRSMTHSSVSISCDKTIAENNEHVYVTFQWYDTSVVHCGGMQVFYHIVDAFGNVLEKRKVFIYDQKAMDVIDFKHCGYYEIQIQSIKNYDILQCFYKTQHFQMNQSIYVFPIYQDHSMNLETLSSFYQESYEYSPYHKGDDYSEIFDIRNYHETDSLRHIHWKASLKKNELFVKEGSQPIIHRIILALKVDSNADKSYEMFYSIGLAFLQRHILFQMVCSSSQNNGIVLETIQTQDYYQKCLKRLMRFPIKDIDKALLEIKEQPCLYVINSQGIEVYQK